MITAKNREALFECNRPTFSVHRYDQDGNIHENGIYLHYGLNGDVSIKIASTLRGFKAHIKFLAGMAEEIAENYEDV